MQLLSALTKRPNFLILDEPTNDLDLDILRALGGYLDDYKGVLVIVSHDRSFTDQVGCTMCSFFKVWFDLALSSQ